MADAAASDPAVTSGNTDTQPLLDYARTLIEGETLMFTLDVPTVPAQQTPIVLAQATKPAAGTTPQPDYILQTCGETESTDDPRSAIRTVDPAYMLKNYLYVASNGQKIVDLTSIKNISLLEGTTHGKIFSEVDNTGLTSYRYDPTPNYIGNDHAEFMAEFEGKVYKIVLELHVFMGVDENNPTCPEPQLIKVNKPQNGSSLIDLNATTFAALEGGALGKTIDRNITLDDNANGYGWYIDLTPGLNEEFLPTSNPYEWVAKPGSEAAGKIDLLTVLLHEAAHSLGLDHTSDAHALMAPTLQPGVRRLPSPELLAELQQLANGNSLASVGIPNDPEPLPMPLPLGVGFTAFWAGRMRKSGFGYVFETNARPAYDVAPNPTLLNPEFAGNTGWNTTGTVTFGSGSAVLTESAVAQTRLNQLFVLGDHDRFLRFTLDNINIDDVNGAPDDAFEVALIDANTGLSLLGDTGLSRGDAFLNLQANGTEYIASQVVSSLNADGSRTYVVDLSGLAAGTVVSLSFDLIGFGRNAAATNSSISVRDLKLGIPQTFDDAVTTAEDTAATIAALANDLDADQPGFVPLLVTAANHGQVNINTDGTFGYTPEQNWSGTDSFSYKLSDGRVDSNIATVTVTVTPVNDAPVAADASFATLEEQGIAIELRNRVSDVDSDVSTFTSQIVTGPANGTLTLNGDGSYNYAPNADFNGVDSFTYRVNDGELDSNIATVTIDVITVNDAPAGQSNTVTTLEDTAYVFQVADFGFSDIHDAGSNAGANNFAAVVIGDLPLAGSLTLNGVAVTVGQSISVTDIIAGNLVFAPASNANGAAYAAFTFQVQQL